MTGNEKVTFYSTHSFERIDGRPVVRRCAGKTKDGMRWRLHAIRVYGDERWTADGGNTWSGSKLGALTKAAAAGTDGAE